MSAATVTVTATLTTETALHQLLNTPGGYLLLTVLGTAAVFWRSLDADAAMEWCETVLRCGGVVHRGAVR